MNEIPRVLHQTYRGHQIPVEYRAYQSSWRTLNPSWEYRLWTDEDNRELIKQRYPWFLGIYDSYEKNIMRADAARYFILDHCGGLYVDLDFECLRPIDALINGRELVFGLEPKVHSSYVEARRRELKRIVCNAFMASVPGHDFWSELAQHLRTSASCENVLDATGPFFLTRAIAQYKGTSEITLLDSEHLYPISNQESWDPQCRVSQAVYAVHHWRGSWLAPHQRAQYHMSLSDRVSRTLRGLKTSMRFRLDGDQLGRIAAAFTTGENDGERKREMLWHGDWPSDSTFSNLPLIVFDQGKQVDQASVKVEQPNLAALPGCKKVSCVMVTKNRFLLAKRAIYSFLNQTYTNKELVILDDGESPELERWLSRQKFDNVVYSRLSPKGYVLGYLRNLAIEQCAGEYITQWDDDDFSHPHKIALQVAAIARYDVEASFLARHQLVFPRRRIIAYSRYRVWEGSFLCRRDRIPYYPHVKRGEDSPIANSIFLRARCVVLDCPELYTYVFHANNTFEVEHFDRHLKVATRRFEGEHYEKKLDVLLAQNRFDRLDFNDGLERLNVSCG